MPLNKIPLLMLTLITLLTFFSFGEDLTQFTNSQKLILNTTSSGANSDIQNLPVLVKLEGSFDFSKAKDNGADIRFTSPDGSNLPYTIDKWDGKKAKVWVLVPVVKANNSDQYITFSYGNDAAGSQDDETSVFKGVEHDMIGIYEKGGFKIVNKLKDETSKKGIKERRMK